MCNQYSDIQYFRDMSEFAKAKVKRENFESHNDKAVKFVEDLLKSKDSKDRVTQSLDNIKKALVGIKNAEEQASLLNSLVLGLAHSRDNNLIEKFLEHLKSTKYLTQAFHALVLKLTCNDDCHTLDTVLRYGKDQNLEPESSGGNPIALASEQVSRLIFSAKYWDGFQGYLQCTKKLYGFGYRITGSKSNQKQNTDEPDRVEQEEKLLGIQEVADLPAGEQERLREDSVKNTQDPDQVRFCIFFEKINIHSIGD